MEPEESGRQEGLVGSRCGAAQGNLEGLIGKLVRVEADEEAVRLRGEGDLGGEADGHGKGEATVVVGVVADDGDASGSTGSGHDPQLVAGRTGLTATGGSGQHPAMAERSGPLSGIKIIELAGIGPAPFTCMMLADAGAEVLRLERAAPGAVERADEARRGGLAAALGPLEPLAALGRDRPQEPRCHRTRARPRRAGGRLRRGVPARGGRAARASGPRPASPATRSSSTGG